VEPRPTTCASPKGKKKRGDARQGKWSWDITKRPPGCQRRGPLKNLTSGGSAKGRSAPHANKKKRNRTVRKKSIGFTGNGYNQGRGAGAFTKRLPTAKGGSELDLAKEKWKKKQNPWGRKVRKVLWEKARRKIRWNTKKGGEYATPHGRKAVALSPNKKGQLEPKKNEIRGGGTDGRNRTEGRSGTNLKTMPRSPLTIRYSQCDNCQTTGNTGLVVTIEKKKKKKKKATKGGQGGKKKGC